MMKKRLSKKIWYGSDVDSEGKPVLPPLAKDSEDLEGLHYGELYLHIADDKLSLWTRTLTDQIKQIGGEGSGGELWKLMETESGEKYLFTELNVVTQMGITSYAQGENLKLPGIYDGLPIDNQTIYWEEVDGVKVLKAKGSGSGEGTISNVYVTGEGNAVTGVELSEDKKSLTFSKGMTFIEKTYLETNYYNSSFIDENYYKKDEFAGKFVDLESDQEIYGSKNFLGKLLVNGVQLVRTDDYWLLEGDLLVTGGITSFANPSGYTPSSIMDALRVDEINLKVIDGVLTFVGSTGGGNGTADKVTWDNIEGKPTWIGESKPSYSWSEITGKPNFVTEEDLEEEGFLTAMDIQALTFTNGAFKAVSYDPSMAPKTVNIPTKLSHLEDDSDFVTLNMMSSYATKTWVGQQGFLDSSDLNGYATETWVGNNYLPLTGTLPSSMNGEFQLQGDLWLRSGTENYGRRIIFGDVRTSSGEPYVYIGEDTEDDLTIASWGDFRIKVGDGAYLTYIKEDGYWEITGDVLVTGGITSYE